MDHETGWLPDLIYLDGEFQSGMALFADATGRITRVSHDAAKAIRLPGRAMLPGLVNAHSHSFQRAVRGRTEKGMAGRDTFWTWREKMYHAANRVSPEAMYTIARMAFLEMALGGITCTGEFHYVHHDVTGAPYSDRNLTALEVARAAAEVGVRIVILRTAYVRAGFGEPADAGQIRFLTPKLDNFIADTEELRKSVPAGIAPHSIRAVPLEYLRELARYARSAGMPLHMHVAEQPAEVDACLAEYGRRPVELLHDENIIDPRFTAVHAIHIAGEEAGFLGGANVCACPTTERNLGDGAVPADLLYAAGAHICFGSDSNVQIDLMEDARALEYDLRMKKLERAILPGGAQRLFQSATEDGARSLQAPGGSLSVGQAADFFTIDLNDPSIAGTDPATLIDGVVFSLERTAIRDVVVGGQTIVQDGRHRLQEEITRSFGEVQRELWQVSP